MTQRISPEYVDEVAAFFEREQTSLVRYARLLSEEAAIAEDLAQVTFMEAARQWRTVRELNPVQRRRWLRRVCSNKWIDEVRRRSTFRRLRSSLAVPEVDLRPDPAVRVEARSALEAAQSAMEHLPHQRRAIALLYWVADYSTKEISEHLDIAQSGVRKQLALAGREIRSAAEPYVRVPMPQECLYPVAQEQPAGPVTAEEGG
ncbi:RNA polymerase sigma factor [Streptomyces sp. NPDC090021]|uniref:RNA polymerase sigma factor n=1 Tax=Streptomyces sp. NPDC090021 TaxID=3365919 RepID=UPI0038234044